MLFTVRWRFSQMSIHWTMENPMSNGCQALNPLYKKPEGVIGQFDKVKMVPRN